MNSITDIPLIPTLRPTMVEFKNLLAYLYDNQSVISAYGGCKIIPPREWTKVKQLFLSSIDCLPLINRQSIIRLSPLVFRLANSQRKTTRQEAQLKDFINFAQRPQNRVPFDVTDIESKFWAMLKSNDISKRVLLRATNIDASLFSTTEKIFNLNNIPLTSLLSITSQRIKGITSPFLHAGMFGSMCALHIEEGDLFSMNYMHEGSSKFWYIVPSSHANQLEQCLADADTLSTNYCSAPLRHKTLFPDPTMLIQSYNIPVYRIEQCPNEIIITSSRAYHWSFDGGLNVTESVNFALPSWIPYGRSAPLCTCLGQDSSVKIDMNPFNDENVNKYTQNYLNSSFHQLDEMMTVPSDEQSVHNLEQMSSSILAPPIVANILSNQVNAFIDDDLFNSSIIPSSSRTSESTCSIDETQLFSSNLTSDTTRLIDELSFDYPSILGSSDRTKLENMEIAAQTALIRRKWIEDKDILMSCLILDLKKPEIGSIGQWETLINSDDVNLDNLLPENIKNQFCRDKKRIESFVDWTVAFKIFRRAALYLFNHRRLELDMYFEHISELCRSYSIKQVLVYEADIRHHVAKMPHLSLMADFSFLMSRHLTTIQATMIENMTGEQQQICDNYNSRFKRCERSKNCSRLHICSICFKSLKIHMKHPAVFCPTQQKNQRRQYRSRRLAFYSQTRSTLSQWQYPSHYPY